MPGKVTSVFALLLGMAICLAPHARRLRNPSLYADDIDRIAQLQTEPLRSLLFAPFNEHLAPLFQLVSWTTWQACGHSLTASRWGFTIASFVPFGLTLALLWRVVVRETGSAGAAITVLAMFSLSWLALETIYWYSASSFMWSLLLTLAAWDSSRAFPRALATAAAPAFSMIGVLAGPVSALRVLATGGFRAWRAAMAPLAGTAGYLAFYLMVHDRSASRTSVQLGAGLRAALQAPAASLVPAVFGVRTLPTLGSWGIWAELATLLAVLGLLISAVRRPEARAWIFGGLVLIAGGYVLTFCPRADGTTRVLETQRYHLFPMLGLILMGLPGLKRVFPCRKGLGLFVGVLVASLLLWAHDRELKGRARFLRFADQAATLSAMDELGEFCTREGITRPQALATLAPRTAEWAPSGRNVLVMLSPGASAPGTSSVRALVRLAAKNDRLEASRTTKK